MQPLFFCGKVGFSNGFQHEEIPPHPMWKTWLPCNSSGEKALYSWEEPVKKEKKTARLSFGKKKKLLHFSPETTMENAGKYFTYKNQTVE